MASKKEADPEAEMRRKFIIKCRFKAIVRLAHANSHWLTECDDEYDGLDNVKRRVAQAVRGKSKKQLLTIDDKTLLNKPAADRTEKEKKYLFRILGGLKCFKRYPSNVKRRLASVTYFMYYGPGRVIVRENHEALAMYFIVSGDVVISQMVMDDLIHEMVRVEIGFLHAGDMFGEVSLLHNIPRTATCTTTSHCEFLVLLKEDFKRILKESVQKQWDEVRTAMESFTYFDALDEVSRREGCLVAKMKEYEKDETILGDGFGVPNFVYFVLSGRMQMIENLQVFVTTRLGKTYYRLYEPQESEEGSEILDIEEKYFKSYRLAGKLRMSIDSDNQSKTGISTQPEKSNEEEVLGNDASEERRANESQAARSSKFGESSASKLLRSSMKVGSNLKEGSDGREGSGVKEESGVEEESGVKEESDVKEGSPVKQGSKVITEEETLNRDRAPSIKLGSKRPTFEEDVNEDIIHAHYAGSEVFPAAPQNLRTYFMQVCQMNAGCSFGFGENMRRRRVVALTRVRCMLLPKIWLLQRNTANIWTRIQHFLNKTVPTTKQLFAEFVRSRQWEANRTELVEEIVARSKTLNWTTLHDVPYSIRIEEMLDI